MKNICPVVLFQRKKDLLKIYYSKKWSVAKGKACQGLPKDLVHSLLESQVESGFTPHNCGALRLLCQNPSCEKHCWNALLGLNKLLMDVKKSSK